MSSNLQVSRSFFNSYDGPSDVITTKHTEFVGFDPKNYASLGDLLKYQAKLADVSVDPGEIIETVTVVNTLLGDKGEMALRKSLVRRFNDDRRNWENRDKTAVSSIPFKLRPKYEEALEDGNMDDMVKIQLALEAFDLEETVEYSVLTDAINADVDADNESDNS